MVNLYKRTFITYWVIAVILLAGLWAWLTLRPQDFAVALFVMLVVILATVFILKRISAKLFNEEVMAPFLNCQINEFMEKLDKRLSRKRSANNRSSYYYLKAMGYNALGDYDKEYECAQNVSGQAYRAEYYKHHINYFINKDMFTEALDYMKQLEEYMPGVRNQQYRESIELFLKTSDYAIKVRQGDYEGAEEFLSEVVEKSSDEPMITRVSYTYNLAKVIFLKGKDMELAGKYFRFVIENAGDTKFRKLAEEKLAQIE